MAQITHLMQAKAAFDAACLEMKWEMHYVDLAAAVNRIQDVLEEEEKRCIRVLLEEEETPAMMMIQEEQEVESRSIGDWLTSVKDVAAYMRAHAREELLGEGDDDEPQHGCNKLIARMKPPCLAPKTTEAPKVKTTTSDAIRDKLEALMAEYEGFSYSKGLPLASCCTEQPSCVGQQSIIVPLGRERDVDKQRILSIITQQAAETKTDQPVILPIFGPAGIGKTTLVKSIFNDPELFQDYAKAWVDTPEGKDLKKIYTSIISSCQALLRGAESPPLWIQLAELFRSGNKKLLLVLDDLWVEASRSSTETEHLMEGLKSLLRGIGRNLVVIVTTPSKSAAGYITSNVIKPYQLQHLDLSHNKFLLQLPESIGDLKQLRSLDLSGCFRLESIPESIGELEELCTLNLSGCFRLERLPERIGELKTLETLDLSGCPQFDPLPENLETKLAKLRYQGSLTIITDGKVYYLSQESAHEDHSQQRCIVASDDQAQSRASTPQDASFVDESSAAEPEITEATDEAQ